ncbi:conserved hypothetical protein [Vibrio phage 168E36-1]|nr:conserved hypothetical protein [Vibrio phage 168E36-1]
MYSDDFIAKMLEDGVIVGYAGDFDFPTEFLRNHTGVGNIAINGNTYFGVGEFGQIGSIENVADANPATVEVSLTGIPGTVFNLVMQGNIRGSNVTIYKVLFNKQGQVLAAAPIVVGQVTDYSHTFDKTGEFAIQVADEFNLYERPIQKFYSHSSWLADNPGDNFWQWVAQMADKKIHWGAEQDGAKFTKD